MKVFVFQLYIKYLLNFWGWKFKIACTWRRSINHRVNDLNFRIQLKCLKILNMMQIIKYILKFQQLEYLEQYQQYMKQILFHWQLLVTKVLCIQIKKIIISKIKTFINFLKGITPQILGKIRKAIQQHNF
ncbi:unnamed protein product [Paramecium pentaurelia]|uniref:Uncharacterized protein n=1 Tax=Paramecium pentaurelia TaxID=43138 RepID=A0A8S1W245_9CILI|nr:unnamed protein product [Paramecium pentaurelia]